MSSRDFAIAGRRAADGSRVAARRARGVARGLLPRRTGKGSFPADYRQRHPIAIKEGDRPSRCSSATPAAGLTPAQRAEVAGLRADLEGEAPAASSSTCRPARRTSSPPPIRCARSRRSSSQAGVPNARHRHPALQPGGAGSRRSGSTIRTSPRRPDLAACGQTTSARASTAPTTRTSRTTTTAAPCSAISPPWWTSRPTWCSRARETPAYTARRTAVLEKYRKGESPATIYPNPRKGKISELGQ